MAISEVRKRANAKYNAKAYDRMEIKVKKRNKPVIEEIAKTNNESTNAYIKNALKARIKLYTGQDIEL